MRVLGLLVAALIVIPTVEIAVLIAVGQQIGVAATIALMLATSALGALLLRREGTRAMQRFTETFSTGRPPGRDVTDGLLVLAGGIFMLVPGFASDVIGLVLLAPPTRALVRPLVIRAVTRRISGAVANDMFGPRRVRVYYGAPDPGAAPQFHTPRVIEGEVITDFGGNPTTNS